jgi:orotate phosphoribosyltransferase
MRRDQERSSAIPGRRKNSVLTAEEVAATFKRLGALVVDTHVVLASGRHSDSYVNKDAIYPFPRAVSQLCQSIAEHFSDKNIEVVAAPAIGGVILSQWVALALGSQGASVTAVYAEKDVSSGFLFRRGYGAFLNHKKVLVVEDILTTGGSLKHVIEAVRTAGGDVVGAGALCNRGGVTASQLGNPPELFCLLHLDLQTWPPEDCPLCRKAAPINRSLGKGAGFLGAT